MSVRTDLIPVALYARVSSDRQDVALSVAAQMRALRDYAERNGYLVARQYVDEAESGDIANPPLFRQIFRLGSSSNALFEANSSRSRRQLLLWKNHFPTRARP